MFSTKSLAAATAAFALISSSTADYNPSGKGNTAVYWVCFWEETLVDFADLSRVLVDINYRLLRIATTRRLISFLSPSLTPSQLKQMDWLAWEWPPTRVTVLQSFPGQVMLETPQTLPTTRCGRTVRLLQVLFMSVNRTPRPNSFFL
jgi:hypothetical protein